MDALAHEPKPETLVHRAREGDRDAEAALCRKFAPAVRAFALRRLGRGEAFDEFVQDAFLLFVKALRSGSVDEPERVGGYLLGICRNLARERVRQRERRRELFEIYGAGLLGNLPSELTTLSPLAVHLEDCMTLLSHRYRELLRLTFVEDKSHEEIAQFLEVTPSNARVMRHRSLGILRECLSRPPSWEAA